MEDKKDWKENIKEVLEKRTAYEVHGMSKFEVIEWIVEQELDKAREEGVQEYISLLQGIEHYEGLKTVRGLAGLDKHEKRDYCNLQRRFEELSKLKDNK